MIRIRIHGRGGQGAVTLAHMLSMAATFEAKYGQSSQGQSWDRRGTPIEGYARISDRPITERGFILEPDYVVILDPTIVGASNPEAGMVEKGEIIANSSKDLLLKHKVHWVDATSIALEKLGAPITNTVMLGAFAAATELINLDSVEKGIRAILGKKFSENLIQKNLEAVRAAHQAVKS